MRKKTDDSLKKEIWWLNLVQMEHRCRITRLEVLNKFGYYFKGSWSRKSAVVSEQTGSINWKVETLRKKEKHYQTSNITEIKKAPWLVGTSIPRKSLKRKTSKKYEAWKRIKHQGTIGNVNKYYIWIIRISEENRI